MLAHINQHFFHVAIADAQTQERNCQAFVFVIDGCKYAAT